MTEDLKGATVPLGVIGALLLCLPCLLPVLAVFVGVGAVSGFGGWLGDNALLVALGGAAVLVGLVAHAVAIIARRRGAAACESRGSDLTVLTDPRAPRA